MGSSLFPVLPVLEETKERLSKVVERRMEGVAFVCVQHLVETTGSLFEALLRLGARAENVFVLGKCYSTNKGVLRRLRRMKLWAHGGTKPQGLGEFTGAFKDDVRYMWDVALRHCQSEGLRSVIVLDDGGYCLQLIPRRRRQGGRSQLPDLCFSGVEQTTRGFTGIGQQAPGDFPIIQVARCAVKQFIEPRMVTEAVLKRLGEIMAVRGFATAYGVIGLGRIGQAVTNRLMELGYKVHVAERSALLFEPYLVGDASGSPLSFHEKAEELPPEAELVFGCTGKDVFKKTRWRHRFTGERVLASCSTGDVEFLTVLKAIKATQEPCGDALGDARLVRPNGTVRVLRGGFPINFDGTPNSVAAADIQVTRCLLLGGLIQAVLSTRRAQSRNARWEKLDPEMQRFIMRTWLNRREERKQWYSEAVLMSFSDAAWINSSSHGIAVSHPNLTEAFRD
jgi:hypothetical protein